jgi:superoxide dismutase, Fe-Mn family
MSMAFKLPDLPYSYSSLEPHIDARTMEIHHQGHHGAYVKNLNAALEGQRDLANKSIEEVLLNLSAVPENIRTAVRNNGGGHFNHSLFWTVMGPGKGGSPGGPLSRKIDETFRSFDGFREEFKKSALGRFGSGWIWLVIGDQGNLVITSTPNQDNPLMEGNPRVVFGLDVWEHAYYLKYQNRRAEYVDNWWNVIDWPAVGERYEFHSRARPGEAWPGRKAA